MVVAPVYARGLALVGRLLIPVLEATPDTQYVVEGGRLLARRAIWLPQEKQMARFKKPLWEPAANYSVPLLAALILATPGWSWRRRGRALALGLGWLTLTQIALVLVTIVDTQQTVIRNLDGTLLQVAGFSPSTQRIFFVLYEFFDLMGRGFFALLIYLGLIALGWNASPIPIPRGQPVDHNAPHPLGSGRKSRGRSHKPRTTRRKSNST